MDPPTGSNSTPSVANNPSKDPARKAKSKDPGWKYGYWSDLANKNIVRCTLCGRDLNQGIKRLKQHLAGGFGDAAKCSKVSAEISREMQQYIAKNQKRRIEDLDDPVHNDDLDIHVEGLEATEGNLPPPPPPSQESRTITIPSSGTASKRKQVFLQQSRGPMDTYVRKAPEEVVSERHQKMKEPMQTTLHNRFLSTEQKKKIDSHILLGCMSVRFLFNIVKSRSFEIMVESIAQAGSGYRPPSYHEVRVPLLMSEKEKITEMKKQHEVYWKQYGCTLMSDGWTDKRGRHLINFLVNCPEGTFFLGSIDASQHIQDADMLFKLLDDKIQEIGEENVIQVITDNASNYKSAGKKLMEKRTTLYWTPCAAHCLDLMLEEVGNMNEFKSSISKGRKVTTFIYRHTRLLEAMRAKTGGQDLIRAGVTRFATAFLTLQSLLKHSDALKQLFVSDDWTRSNLAKTEAGKQVADTLLSVQFWNRVQDCLKASKPIVAVLRIVDGDEKPAMPEIYLAIEEAKKK